LKEGNRDIEELHELIPKDWDSGWVVENSCVLEGDSEGFELVDCVQGMSDGSSGFRLILDAEMSADVEGQVNTEL
jgi:hypothetical protein